MSTIFIGPLDGVGRGAGMSVLRFSECLCQEIVFIKVLVGRKFKIDDGCK